MSGYKTPFYAADFALGQIPDLLCEDGPCQCPTCEVPCAFGLRFLAEIDSDPQPGVIYTFPAETVAEARTLELQRRVYGALVALEGGADKNAIFEEFGFNSRKRMTDAIYKHKEKALARFGGGKAQG